MAKTDPVELADELLDVGGSLVQAARRSGHGDLQLELSVAQMELLRVVRRQPGLTVTEAAEQLRLARNTVSTLVGQLTGRGLVYRLPDAQDGRVGRLRVSPAAEQQMSAWRARRLATTAAVVAELSGQEARDLTAALPALRRLAARLGQGVEPSAQ